MIPISLPPNDTASCLSATSVPMLSDPTNTSPNSLLTPDSTENLTSIASLYPHLEPRLSFIRALNNATDGPPTSLKAGTPTHPSNTTISTSATSRQPPVFEISSPSTGFINRHQSQRSPPKTTSVRQLPTC